MHILCFNHSAVGCCQQLKVSAAPDRDAGLGYANIMGRYDRMPLDFRGSPVYINKHTNHYLYINGTYPVNIGKYFGMAYVSTYLLKVIVEI